MSLYDLDGYGAAVSMLCARVAGCDDGDTFYPNCIAEAEARLTAAGVEEREAYLTMFADVGCLETCDAARSCFDEIPLCGSATTTCTVEAQCCGFWKAGARCEDTACCQPNGIPCATDDDCCAAKCLAGEDGKTCGGVACAPLDAACDLQTPCCDDEHQCSIETGTCVRCLPLDGTCDSGDDCCSKHCEKPDGDGGPGFCANPPCGLLDGVKCDEAAECCGGHCVPVARDGFSICNDADCLPLGLSCDDAHPCCAGACVLGQCVDITGCTQSFGQACEQGPECCEGVCHPVIGECCLFDSTPCTNSLECCGDSQCLSSADGTTTCQSNAACLGHGDACENDTDCCAQKCSRASGGCCKVVATACSHSVCAIGGDPLQPECSDAVPTLPPKNDPEQTQTLDLFGGPGCIQAICDTPGLEHCCCDVWSAACRDAAKNIDACDVDCAATNPG